MNKALELILLRSGITSAAFYEKMIYLKTRELKIGTSGKTNRNEKDAFTRMKVFINGETKEISREVNLSELLDALSLPRERVAVELNRTVVRRKDWEQIKINESDQIEIVHFVGGG